MQQLRREHPSEFTAAFRRFGVSAYDIGTDRLCWAEAADLTLAALGDTSSPLFAVVSGWAYPASMPELLQLSATVGEKADQVMPWAMADKLNQRRKLEVSDEEAAADLAELQALLGR